MWKCQNKNFTNLGMMWLKIQIFYLRQEYYAYLYINMYIYIICMCIYIYIYVHVKLVSLLWQVARHLRKLRMFSRNVFRVMQPKPGSIKQEIKSE